jgi:hypothetical protein
MKNPRALATIWYSLVCAVMPAPSQVSPEILLLVQIREHIKKDLAEAGNSTCVESVARSSRKTEGVQMQSIDTLRFEVARIGGKELFSFPGERRFTQRSLTELVGMGMTAEGLFGSFALELFSSNVPTILPAGDSTSTGRRIVRYNFRFPLMMSHYTLTNATGSARVGWSGSFWADAESLELVRLRVEADDIPVELGIRSAVTEIEYGKYQMDTAILQLPQTSTVTMTYWNGAMSVNRTDFSQCRAFSAASNVSFDEATPTGPVFTDVPESALPDGLTIRLHLDQPVEFGQAVVGDPISATVEADVRERGKTWLTKGTTISGRVRRLEKQESPSDAVVIDLEFSETSQQGTRLRFTGTIVASDFAEARIPKLAPTSPSRGRSPEATAPATLNEFVPSDVPGVATFLVRAKPYRVPGGFKMIWKTYRTKAARGK